MTQTIPEWWEELEIWDIVSLAQWVAINAKTKHVLCEEWEGLPLLKINNLLNDTIDQYANPELVPQKAILKNSDVVYTRTWQVGRVFTNKVWILHNNSFKVTPKKWLNSIFLYRFLKQKWVYNYVQKVASWSVQLDLNHSAFKTIPMLLPPLPEQQAIAEVLSSLDDKIELLREQNKTLESIAQTIFHEWFVKFNLPAEAGFPGATGEMEYSELGMIPKGWRVGKVWDILERHQVSQTYSKDDVKQYGQIPVYEQWQGLLLWFIDDKPTFSATPSEPIFIFWDHTCVTKLLLEPFSLSSNTIPITWKDYPTIWVYYATSRLQDFLEYRRHRMEWTHKELIIPPITLAEKYSQIIQPMLMKTVQNENKIQTLSKTRDTLLPRLMSGEVRVRF